MRKDVLRKSARLLLALGMLGLLLSWPAPARANVELIDFAVRALPDGAVIITWSTATEIGTGAFQLNRGPASAGPFAPLGDPVPAKTGDVTGDDYEVIDRDVVPGTTYYYRLDEIETNGTVVPQTDWIRGAIAGVLATLTPTAPPTATATRTATATVPASGTATATEPAPGSGATATRTATATATRTATPTATTVADPPTVTRQFTNTPVSSSTPTAQPTTTATPVRTATATAGGVTTPTRTPGAGGGVSPLQPSPTPAVTRPAATSTPAPAPTAAVTVSARPPTASPSPVLTPLIFTSKGTSVPVARATPTPSAAGRRDERLPLLLGGGAVGLAALLGFAGVLVWRARRQG